LWKALKKRSTDRGVVDSNQMMEKRTKKMTTYSNAIKLGVGRN
jgi:hypothetical protein